MQMHKNAKGLPKVGVHKRLVLLSETDDCLKIMIDGTYVYEVVGLSGYLREEFKRRIENTPGSAMNYLKMVLPKENIILVQRGR